MVVGYQLIPLLAAAMAVSVLLLLAAAYWRLWMRLRRLRQEEELVLSRARQKAMHIVQTALDQALQIMARGKISADKSQVKLGEKLRKISAEQLREFQGLITNISKNIEVDAMKEVEEFRQALESRLEQELAEVKKRRLADLDSRIGQIIAQVARQMTGKVISVADHVELIIAALEDAKRRHLV